LPSHTSVSLSGDVSADISVCRASAMMIDLDGRKSACLNGPEFRARLSGQTAA
jgi:hypothetical protein